LSEPSLVSILQNSYQETIILTKNGIHNNTESIVSSELFPLLSYEAYTQLTKNGNNEKIAAREVADKSESSGGVFHSDIKSKKLLFTNLEVGAQKIYSYQSNLIDPYLLHKYVFASGVPIEESSLEIKVDKDIEIGYKIFNDTSGDIVFNQSKKRGKNIYTWSINKRKPIKAEGSTPGILHLAPHIIIYIKTYKDGKNTKTVLGTPSDLYTYYKNFVKDLNIDIDTQLMSITHSLTNHLSSESEKIKAIFYWVKDNIKYVAFEYGYEGFIPREASLVCERRYGDCKDMSSIIHTMAKYAGMDNVHLCWIGTRRLPYSYATIATPAVDDHMIASIVLDGEYIFLDATDRETMFGLPTGFIQDKEALVGLGDTFVIIKVPIVPPSQNLIEDKLSISVDGNKIMGHGTLQMLGHSRSNFLSTIGDANKTARFEIIKNLVLKGNNKFKLKEFSEQNTKDRDLPYIVDYDFTLENYMISAGNESYISLILQRPFEKNIIENEREAPYDFGFLTQNKYTIEMEIPEGKKVKSLPQKAEETNDLLQYNISYTLDKNKVILDLDIKNKKLTLSPSDFALWNQTIKNVRSKYQESIVLVDK